MASAFDGIDPRVAEFIETRLLAGDTMEDVRTDGKRLAYVQGISPFPEITGYRMRKLRNEVFGKLQRDPEAVKALANGPCLNPGEIVRYTHAKLCSASLPNNWSCCRE